MNEGDVTMNVALVKQLMEQRCSPQCRCREVRDAPHVGWTWSELARQMGMSKSTVSRVSNFDKLPGRKFIFALQRVFPEHRDHLFAKVGEQPPPAPADAA